MSSYVIGLEAVDRTQVPLVGGKGAQLGELSRVDGLHVPPGFCVTTDAFRRIMADTPSVGDLAERLARLDSDDRYAIGSLCDEIRLTIGAIPIPDDLAAAITRPVALLGIEGAYAVRSSATAEDLPSASFAGQHDTYLNVVGPASILEHVRRCWASLFTDRAVTYRLRNGFDHRKVNMAVVVQKMVVPQASGVVFTADPVTSNRKVVSVEATFGLGEGLVSGLVNADTYKVRDGEVIANAVATKIFAVHARPGGGTQDEPVDAGWQKEPTLTDAQVVELARLGRRIEAHFGYPQDIEWCLGDDGFHIVQSRPITTLFPIPPADDDGNHVFVSVGHGQMMTDAMKPLGLSFWKLTTPARVSEAGGRLFVDVTGHLASPTARPAILKTFRELEPLMGDALLTIVERGDFISSLAAETTDTQPPRGEQAPIETDPAIVVELIEQSEASIASLKSEIRNQSGAGLLDFIQTDIHELKRILFDPRSHQVFMGAMEAAAWLNENLEAWLGERSVADSLTQSVPHNVTSAMGLALLDVADVIRPHRDVVAFLQTVHDEGFLARLDSLEGGRQTRKAIEAFLDQYGMRCVGEIDITSPRWAEQPTALLPILLGHIQNVGPGEAERRFEEGRKRASEKEQEVLARLLKLPDGASKAEEAKQRIDRVRTFIGYREYPKYGMVSRYFVYKQALLSEATRLVQARVLREADDIFYLTVPELDAVVRTRQLDPALIDERKDAFRSHQRLMPPRVITSEGEVVNGKYRRDGVPPGALIGLPVSAGTVEGRARVIRNMADADLAPGDILVTAYTDPSWTPLFVAVNGLVTEVGGLMTHGSVIAREYGLPAVVGVEHATRLIKDGQRIRVHGTDGYVEILSDGASRA